MNMISARINTLIHDLNESPRKDKVMLDFDGVFLRLAVDERSAFPKTFHKHTQIYSFLQNRTTNKIRVGTY